MRYQMKENSQGWDMYDSEEECFMNIDEVIQKMNEQAAEIERLEQRLKNLAEIIHYPKHWDTACYETLEDALHEIGCSECKYVNVKEVER